MNLMKKILLSFLLSILSFACYHSIREKVRIVPKEIDLQGHRGARGLKPENTLPGFLEALNHGVKTLELDTVLTSDLNLLIHHNTDTNPSLCQYLDGKPIESRPIRTLPISELKKMDCGSKKNPDFQYQDSVPGTSPITLDELFLFIKKESEKDERFQKVQFNIEMKFGKDAGVEEMEVFAKRITEVISSHGMVERSTVQSFLPQSLPIVRKHIPEIKTSALYAPTLVQGITLKLGLGSWIRESILEDSKANGASIVSPYLLYVDQDFVRKAHSMGLKVIPWTVNDPEEMKSLIRLGVDGLISDYPNRMRRAVDELPESIWN